MQYNTFLKKKLTPIPLARPVVQKGVVDMDCSLNGHLSSWRFPFDSLNIAIRIVILNLALGVSAHIGWAAPAPTTTTLTLTSGGNPITTLVRGNVITLTATVMAGASPATPGQVDFCDASVTYCTDIHLLGTSQLSKSGVAQLKYLPGNGSHSYRAIFKGTNSYARSSSAATPPLMVSGPNPSATMISSSGNVGDYTLTATVASTGGSAIGGEVSFHNASSGDSVLGSATLGANSSAWTLLSGFWAPYVPYAGEAVTGDFNGDGILDIVYGHSYICLMVVGCQDAGVFAALGDGKGIFTSAPSLDLGKSTGIGGLLVADFDADGIPDLAFSDLQGFITILKGNGDGTFSSNSGLLSTGSPFTSYAIGDFNHDGLPDFAVVGDGAVSIFRGNGDGTFSPSTAASTSIGPTSTYGTSILSGDFNADGISDLAVANAYARTVTILLGIGDETFRIAQTINPTTGVSIVAADFNEDGKVDLVLNQNYSATVLLGNGDGTFSTTAQGGVGFNAGDMAFGDFEGTGHAGLAIMEGGSGPGGVGHSLTVLPGKEDGTFGPEFQFPIYFGNDPPVYNICVADFNGDGRSDLAVRQVLLSTNQTATAIATGISIPPATGRANVVASYQGDSNYLPSTSAPVGLQAAAGAPTVSLTVSPNPAPFGSPVTLTVTVSGSGLMPTGFINFYDGTSSLGQMMQLNGNAVAISTATGLALGTHYIYATYGGDSNYTSGRSSVLTLTVDKGVPTAALSASAPFLPAGTPITFTATLTGGSNVPTGSITFKDGTAQLAQVTLNTSGIATYTTASLAEGTHTIVLVYSGDANYGPVTSSSVQVVSSSKPFITVTGTAVTIAAGAISGNISTITITPQQGFVGSVSFTAAVSTGPAGGQYPPTVSLSTSSVNIAGTSPAAATLTVSTTAPHSALATHPNRPGAPWHEGVAAALACLFLLGIPARRRAVKCTLVSLALFLALSAGALSCGGGGGDRGGGGGTTIAGTTPGAYAITVTATSGPIIQQGSIALTVK